MHAGMYNSIPHRCRIVAAIHPSRLVTIGEGDGGAVEFVSDNSMAGRIQRRVRNRDRVAISQGEVRGEPCRSGQHIAHRVPIEFGGQIDKARAFGVQGRAGVRQVFDLAAHQVVGGQLRGELLGKSAG